MNNTLIFVGMDTHKEFTEVAYSLDGRDEHSHHHGKIPTTKQALSKLARQLQSNSSGDHQHRGRITKCGNTRARRLLVEGAHSYRYPANISTEMQIRQEVLPKAVIDQAWQAQLRLCRRYQRLMHRGKHRSIVVTAIAREMIANIWSISNEVVLTPVNPRERLSRVPA